MVSVGVSGLGQCISLRALMRGISVPIMLMLLWLLSGSLARVGPSIAMMLGYKVVTVVAMTAPLILALALATVNISTWLFYYALRVGFL